MLEKSCENSKFGALITFHCEESNNSMTAVCGSDGEWFPNPASLMCGESGNTPSGTDRNPWPPVPTVPPVGSSYSGIYVGISVAALFLLILLTTTISIVVAIMKRRR